MASITEVLQKLPNQTPLSFVTSGTLIESKVREIQSRLPLLAAYVIRGMSIILQNVPLSSLSNEELLTLSNLRYELLDAKLVTDNKTPIVLEGSTPPHDTLKGYIRSQMPQDKVEIAHSYSTALLNLQTVSLYELVKALSNSNYKGKN